MNGLRPGAEIISSDVECVRILTDAGMLAALVPVAPYNRAMCMFQDEDWYSLGMREVGHTDDKENGFVVIRLSKAVVPMEAAIRFLCECMHQTAVGPSMPVWATMATLGEN